MAQTTMKGQRARYSYVLGIASVAAFGGFLFGYDTAVIAGAIGFLKIKFDLSPLAVGWAASSAIWGCLLGAMIAGWISDLLGRKKVLILTAILFCISALASAVTNDFTIFILARLVGGIGVGATSMVSPLYISEVAPAKIRGSLVSIYQLAIVLGINFIYFINYEIATAGTESWNVNYGWRYMIGSEILPAIIFLILLFFVPESPRWCLQKGKQQEAENTLRKINAQNATKIIQEIKDTLNQDSISFLELFRPHRRKAIVVGVILAFFSQITGINAIIYYAPEIFKSIGNGTESALFQTIIIGLVTTVFTLVALWLIDKAGRKKLLVWGVSGMLLCLMGISMCFHFKIFSSPWLLIFILGYTASFSASLGPIPWVLISEIFPSKLRGLAMSFCTFILWIGVVLITQLTPYMMENLGGALTFGAFAFNSVVLLIFTIRYIPETKQRTLEEIEENLNIHSLQ